MDLVGTSVLPDELLRIIIYHFKGVEHPVASLLKKDLSFQATGMIIDYGYAGAQERLDQAIQAIDLSKDNVWDKIKKINLELVKMSIQMTPRRWRFRDLYGT